MTSQPTHGSADAAILVAVATDLEVLAEAALRIAANLRSGLADLDGASPHRTVGTDRNTSGAELLTAADVAELLGVEVRTLRRMRHENRAPRPVRGKGPLRWRRSDVDAWIGERES